MANLFWPMILLGQLHQATAVKMPLQIGETMPKLFDYTVIDAKGNIQSPNSGAADFERLKGKLIVLDFWTTNCSSCLDNFPHISDIQRKFKNEIKIVLVNTAESAQKISSWIKERNRRNPDNPIIPENLQILISKELGQYFPMRHEIGYHVWIGKDKKFILRGIHENTNPGKIKKYFSGEQISFLPDEYGKSLEQPILLSNSFDKAAISSVIQPFIINENPYSKAVYGKIDLSNNTIRTTQINAQLLKFFRYAYEYRLKSNVYLNRPRDYDFGNVDPSSLTSDKRILGYQGTDLTIIKSAISYEIISPTGISDSIVREKVGADLEFYCEQNLKLTGSVADLPTKVYKLVVSDNEKFNKIKFNNNGSFASDSIGSNQNRYRIWQGYRVDEALHDYFNYMIHKFNEIVKNEVKYDGKIKIALPVFPSGNSSVIQLREYLQPFGLDVVESIEPVKTLVFSKK